ncbi:MAG: alpha/beta hydrolase [Pseudohongiellaceae bacterium]|nr:alpha/beta hydrolase [Pseudohongiellaceae bacterium]
MKKIIAFLMLLTVSVLAQAQEPKSATFQTSDGVKIHYLTLGDSGSWVVLIHGYTDSARRMYFSTGIAQELAKNHRVVAIDNRNHGQSEVVQENGIGLASDTVELMAHLGIEKAHIHGYSMGGSITGQLLRTNPELFITASFGGSGIRESDPELAEFAQNLDPVAPEPTGTEAAAFRNLRAAAASRAGASARPAIRTGAEFDLSTIEFPVLAINGEYDRPYSKVQKMVRELRNFQNVILPEKSHMTAIAVGAPMPQLYIDALATFINANDM